MVYLVNSKIEKELKNQYNQERKNRWSMADKGEEIAIEKICDKFSKILQIPRGNITHIRFDKLWFDKYDVNKPENEWVKGASDFAVQIILSNKKYILVEVKLKSQEYRKTTYGGTTTNGSYVSNYGCNSYYLDVIPVHRNMNSFIEKTNKKPSSFIIAFVKEDYSELNIISLAKINKMIKNGWVKNGKIINLCVYGDGYGQRAYLIPKDATTNGDTITKEQLETILLDKYPIP